MLAILIKVNRGAFPKKKCLIFSNWKWMRNEITEMLFSHLKGLNQENSPQVKKQQKVGGTKNADTFNQYTRKERSDYNMD